MSGGRRPEALAGRGAVGRGFLAQACGFQVGSGFEFCFCVCFGFCRVPEEQPRPRKTGQFPFGLTEKAKTAPAFK